MAAKSLGRYHSGSSATPTTFTIPTGPDFRPNAMLPQYPTSLAFWHNPHLLQQPIPDPSIAAAQSQMPGEPPEQKKHKRTRSGCFTCRSRRIKVSWFQVVIFSICPRVLYFVLIAVSVSFNQTFCRKTCNSSQLANKRVNYIQCDETHPVCESKSLRTMNRNDEG